MNKWKIIYWNCGERSEFIDGHRSYTHNLCSCGMKAFHGYITKLQCDQLPVGLIAQLVEHRTGIIFTFCRWHMIPSLKGYMKPKLTIGDLKWNQSHL